MEYGKLENGLLFNAPKRVVIDNKLVINPSETKLKELGYIPIERDSLPKLEEDEIAKTVYEIIDGKIHVSYVVEKIEIEETEIERKARAYDILVGDKE